MRQRADTVSHLGRGYAVRMTAIGHCSRQGMSLPVGESAASSAWLGWTTAHDLATTFDAHLTRPHQHQHSEQADLGGGLTINAL